MSNKKEVLFLREEYGEGRGKFTYPHGEKYEGEWEKGKYHGQGNMTYPDGSMYVGEFKDGEYHGQGTYTWSDGGKYEGKWKNGEIWNGTEYDKYGNIIYRWVEGKRKYHNLYKSY